MGDESELKKCPDCAEQVLADANVCRYCGYRFRQPPPTASTSGAKASPAKKAIAITFLCCGFLMVAAIVALGIFSRVTEPHFTKFTTFTTTTLGYIPSSTTTTESKQPFVQAAAVDRALRAWVQSEHPDWGEVQVTCPGRVPLVQGTTFTCSTDTGRSVKVTVADVNGRFTFEEGS